MWLLKPTGLNRGRGIEIFDSLEELERILLDFLAMMNRKKLKEKNDRTIEKEKETRDVREPERISMNNLIDADTVPVTEKPFASEKFKLNTCSFVIQKYVEKPLLIQDRKFDIRTWVLLTDDLTVYFFK